MITSQQTTQRSTDTLTLHKIHFSLAQTEVQLPHVRFHITVSIVSQQNINYVALSFLIDLRTSLRSIAAAFGIRNRRLFKCSN